LRSSRALSKTVREWAPLAQSRAGQRMTPRFFSTAEGDEQTKFRAYWLEAVRPSSSEVIL
jgi:hypothetical protein